MGRFKSIVGGPRQRRTITLPFPNARYNPIIGAWEGETDMLDLRALRPDEYDKVIENAKAFAKSHGVEDPKDGDEHFERGRMLHTLLVTCLDKDSPTDAPVPYFESLEELQTSENLLLEMQQYLYQHQRMWQDEVSPLRMNLSAEEYIAGIVRVTKGDIDFFLSMRPGMQWSCFTRMASQLLSSMTPESPSSSPPDSPQTIPSKPS